MKIVLNEDKEKVKEIREALEKNNGYCPCRLLKTPESKCPCKEFREQTVEGLCHCKLYRKIEE